MLTSQDYSPTSAVYVPEPISHLGVFSINRNAIGCHQIVSMMTTENVQKNETKQDILVQRS